MREASTKGRATVGSVCTRSALLSLEGFVQPPERFCQPARTGPNLVGADQDRVLQRTVWSRPTDSVKELVSVLRTFTELAHDSLILANVARMAKYGRISNSGRPDDGLFEVVCCRHGARWRTHGSSRCARGTGEPATSQPVRISSRRSRFPSESTGKSLHLEAGSQVVVECVPRALTTVG